MANVGTNQGSGDAFARAVELHKAGQHAEAAAAYQAGLAAHPRDARGLHFYGVLLLQTGRTDEAVQQLSQAVAAAPQSGEVRNNYGVALRESGRRAEAIEAFRAAIASHPDLFDAHNNLASTLLAGGDNARALEAGNVAHRLNQDHVEPLLTIGSALLLMRDPEAALPPIRRVMAMDPGNDRAVALYRTAMSRMVQPWHFPMMNDGPRNDAYEAAIKRAVTPGALVLDIGTGAGLLSMMSARAGAKQVVTCEMTGPVAAKAQQLIARNGLADKITVHNKKSNDLTVGVELPERADVLVSEIFDSDLLGEGVLPSLEDAHARLIKPGAKIVPQAASAMVALVGGDQLQAMVHVDKASGFDVSGFNEFMPERFVFDGMRFKFDWLSEPVAGLSFDFRQPRYRLYEHLIEMKVTRPGFCLGVVQWLKIDLDEQTTFENRPGGSPEIPTGWLHSLYTFAPPVQVEAGQTVRVLAGHSRTFPYFRLAEIV
jgi:tetratricopeptide (TPR) repeat protein